jgi:hypothetical protein
VERFGQGFASGMKAGLIIGIIARILLAAFPGLAIPALLIGLYFAATSARELITGRDASGNPIDRATLAGNLVGGLTAGAMVAGIAKASAPVEEPPPGGGGGGEEPPSGGVLSWEDKSRMLRTVLTEKGNHGLGAATAAEAEALGRDWVGEGYRVASDGATLLSRDGLRRFRPPSYKQSLGGYQANFERLVPGQHTQEAFSNGHLDIIDLPYQPW